MTTLPGREPVLRALTEICGPHFARLAGAADTVGGRQATFVAAPATVAAVADTLRLAAARGLAVVSRGAGTKIDWGMPPPGVDLLLDTGRLAGIWHHQSDTRTAEIGLGTPVRAVQAALALRQQRLAVDPASPGATLGGVVAVNEGGPLRYRYGPPVTQLRGLSYVDPDGTPAQADPADLDPAPAGVLVSATVALQPLPEARRWVTRAVSTPLQVHTLVGAVIAADVDPAAIEVDLPANDPPGRGEPRPGELGVLLEGGPVSVRERAARLQTILGPQTGTSGAPPAWWGRYPFGADDVAVRIAVPITDLHAAVYALRDAAGTTVPVRGAAGLGTVHAVLPGRMPPERVEAIMDAVRGVLLARGGRCVVVAAPPQIRAAVEMASRNDLF